MSRRQQHKAGKAATEALNRAAALTLIVALAGALALNTAPAERAELVREVGAVEAIIEATKGELAPADVIDVAREDAITVDEAITTIGSGAAALTVGVSVEEGMTASELTTEVEAHVADLAADLKRDPTPDGSLEKSVAGATEAIKKGVEFTEVHATVEESFQPPAGTEVTEAQDPSPAGLLELVADEDCSGKWYPNYARLNAGKSSIDNRRFATVRFAYTSSARLKNLKCYTAVTLEPDLKTHNYDGKHYFDRDIKSWSSNLPKPYKDTNFLDDADEYVFTIGTAMGSSMSVDTEYRNYFRTAYGNVGSDKAALAFQRGRRTIVGCYSTWCIFSRGNDRYTDGFTWNIPSQKLVTR